jgi:transcriptional regulator with XRE-family HTH domain/tetratricopeptide (TPR) repeat protein
VLDNLTEWLRQQRLARGWSIAEMGRQLQQASKATGDQTVPSTAILASYVRRWEAGKIGLTERYRLHYCTALGIPPAQFGPRQPQRPLSWANDSTSLIPGAGMIPVDVPPSTATDKLNRSERTTPAPGAVTGDTGWLADEISELVTWVETTNVGVGTIGYLDDAVLRLANECLTAPPSRSYERAAALARRVFVLIQGGRQRIGQTRDLYVIAGKLCAVLSWLSSDLGQLAAAGAHCRNGWILADEADHDGLRALLLCAQSKNAFWEKRYDDAALCAHRGYQYKPPGTAPILLACQEADALQALGRIDDAREALRRADQIRGSATRPDELGGIFACGRARQANYSIATSLRAKSAREALHHAERAETAWSAGEQWAYGTWAQVQIGAAIAHVINHEVELAASVLQPVLTQPAEQRLATVTTRLGNEVGSLLTSPMIAKSRPAVLLHQQITDYCEAQPRLRMLPSGRD